jgi:hypothetical protein
MCTIFQINVEFCVLNKGSKLSFSIKFFTPYAMNSCKRKGREKRKIRQLENIIDRCREYVAVYYFRWKKNEDTEAKPNPRP